MSYISKVSQQANRMPLKPIKRVLIVEDNKVHRRLMESELRGQYDLEFAADSQTAWEYLSTDQASNFDLVILDLSIPKQVGEVATADEALKILRNSRRGLVIVVVSGSPTDHLRRQLDQLGVKRIFEKPFSLPEFREYIDRLLDAIPEEQSDNAAAIS